MSSSDARNAIRGVDSERTTYGCCAKQCYAFALFASAVAPFATGGMRNVYILNFGADVQTMAICFAILNFWGAFNEIVRRHIPGWIGVAG